jgi:glycosyltransferase involved in cell wall biosynthesis
VTPSYNQAAYLEQTLNSVLGQDYPRLKYLVVDGASSDGSLEIIRKYADKLSWWVSEPDRGQAEAINKGLRRARGEIVAWLNSDDFYLPGAIQLAVQVFREHPEAGLVYGDTLSVDEKSEPIYLAHYTQWSLADLLAFNILGQPAVFLRRDVLEEAGYLDPSYHFLLDHQLWLRMAALAPMVYTPRRLAAGRYHAAAKNVARAAEFGREAYRILEWAASQPQIAPVLAANRRRAWAGAHRFNARYLLDGDQTWAALKSYGRSLSAHAPTALVEWKRILFAFLSLLGFGGVRAAYYRRRQQRARQQTLSDLDGTGYNRQA